MVSATSCPYAPTFCTGVPPALPGMPLRHSTPAQLARMAFQTKRSQDSPAPTSKRILASCSRLGSASCFNSEDCDLQHQPRPSGVGHQQIASAPSTKMGRIFRTRAKATAAPWTSPVVLASTKA